MKDGNVREVSGEEGDYGMLVNGPVEQHIQFVQNGNTHLCSIALQFVRSNLLRMPFPCTPPPCNSMFTQ